MKAAMAAALSTLHEATKRRYVVACESLRQPLSKEKEAEYTEVRDELKRRMDELAAKIEECKHEKRYIYPHL